MFVPELRPLAEKASYRVMLLLMAFAACRPAAAQVVAQYDFEDGTTQGWTSFCGATVNNTTDASESGTHSLKVTGRTLNCAGPSKELVSVLLPQATYQITAWARLTGGETSTDAANMTIKQVDTSSGTNYVTVGNYSTNVNSSGWTLLTGNYTVSGSPTSLLLYVQLVGNAPNTSDSFYVDNITIKEISGPPGGPQDNSGISTTFEDGGLDGWSSRAGCILTNTTADAHSGARSLLATSRTAAYDGPQISVSNKMYNGSTYSVSVWVKLGPSATQSDTLRVSLQTTLSGSTSYHTVINNTTIPLGAWVQLSISRFAMGYPYDPNTAFLYVESNSGTQDFYIDDFTLTYIQPPQIQTDIPSIYQTLAYYFPVGAEIDTTDLSGPHAQLLAKHFNSIVSGNDMKWSSTEPMEGSFTFTNADAEASFATSHNMLVRGHNLLWATGEQVPSWVFLEKDGVTPLSASNPADVALLSQRIQNHINGVVPHFGSKVYVWDVVNEPIDASQPDCLAHGPFYNVLGKRYIDIALEAARAANPASKLYINDYNTEIPSKLACLVQVLRDLQGRGIPIDGVGHESHNHINFPPVSALVNAVNTIAQLGLDQQVTEFDLSVYSSNDNSSNYGANGGTVPPSIIAQQGYLYAQFFQAMRQLKGKLSGVTMWGMADDNTWLSSFPISRLDEPLPFDANLQAKPAYWGIVDPTKLPGYGLSFSVTSKTGPQNARVWTITANNPSQGTAYATQINGFTLTQVAGAACTPVITPPGRYPVVLGDIAGGQTASTAFTIDFTGCPNLARFTLNMPWSSANGADTGTLASGNQFR
ncbi:MAG: endo-1,4-beta-xylanase [Acidobacteriaceae bacterium]|nr:endo-1,4-beta-xylanase [Acidobacteriaceae bacterium]